MTQTAMVQVVCPDCQLPFEVPDGAAEAQCPNCAEFLVWRSCLDTNEVFTVMKKWETWIHPGCDTKHPVDLTHVIAAARPQNLDPSLAPVIQPDGPPPSEQTVYSPVEIASDVEWPDQDISGRLMVDSDRIAILPGPGVARAPLSVAWLRDVVDYSVTTVATPEGEKKRKVFGRRAKDEGPSRPTLLLLGVPGGQISLNAAGTPEQVRGQLDQYLRPRMASTQAAEPGVLPQQPPAFVAAQPQPETGQPESAQPEIAMSDAEQDAASGEPTGVADTASAAPVDGSLAETAASDGMPGVVEGVLAPDGTGPEQPASEHIVASSPAHAAGDPAQAAAPAQGLAGVDPSRLPDLDPKTPEAVYESIRKLAELAVLGEISSDEFAARKAELLSRL